MHMKPIKSLPEVEAGVAAFENSIYEYTQAGGIAPSDKEMKDDLLRLLPEKIQSDLLWDAANLDVSFTKFRDIVVSQTDRLLNIKKPQRGIHQVGDEAPAQNPRAPEGMESEAIAMFENVNDTDELIAAFQNFKAWKN